MRRGLRIYYGTVHFRIGKHLCQRDCLNRRKLIIDVRNSLGVLFDEELDPRSILRGKAT